MFAETQLPEAAAADLAREVLYRFLAAVVGGPYADGWDRVQDNQSRALVLDAADLLRDTTGTEGPLGGSGTSSAEDLGFARLDVELNATPDELRVEYDRLFGLVVPKECPPYETEYYPTVETFACSQLMADVAGFYRAFGITTSQRSPERPDFLGLQLEFMAFVLMKKRYASAALGTDPSAAEWVETCDRAQRTFFHDHLAWWVPSFAAGLRRKTRRGCYLAVADVLTAWVPAECRRLEIPVVLRPARPELIERAEEQSGCATCSLSP